MDELKGLFEIRGPITDAATDDAGVPDFDAVSRGQYQYCKKGGANGRIELYHVVATHSGQVVGFMGLERHVEIFRERDPVNAWISIEYIHIEGKYRLCGLEQYCLNYALRSFKPWLERQRRQFGFGRVVCMSASNHIGLSSKSVLTRLHSELRRFSTAIGVKFVQ